MINLKQLLAIIKAQGTVIDTVYVSDTQNANGEPDLVGVTVADIQTDYILFSQAGSGGNGYVLVPTEKILSIAF